MDATTAIVSTWVEEIRTRIVRQLGTCRVAILNDPCAVRDFHDGVAPVVTRIISDAQTNLEAEIARLTAWNQQQAQEACDYMARIQKLTAEVDRLRARESALLDANNLELERRRQAERERDNMRETWERAWAQPTPAEYQERIRGLLATIGRFVDAVKALLAGGPGCHCDGAGCAHCRAEALLKPARPHQPFEYDAEPEATQCH